MQPLSTLTNAAVVFVDGAVGRAVVDGERVTVAVEDAGEVMLADARHAGDRVLCHADVRAKFHGFVDEVALGVVGQQVAEYDPASGGVDGVLRTRIVDGEVVGTVWLQRLAADGCNLFGVERAAVGCRAVVERLAALDVHGAGVTVRGNEVGAFIQTEGDGAAGEDARVLRLVAVTCPPLMVMAFSLA